MSKIPCGGFILDDNFLTVEENKLTLSSGESNVPYKSLVTDGTGKVKWDDRLAYDDTKLYIDFPPSTKMVKVADEVPEWLQSGKAVNAYLNGLDKIYKTIHFIADESTPGMLMDDVGLAILVLEANENTLPETGVYFYSYSSSAGKSYVSRLASIDSDEEITWDGSLGGVKQLDKKFIPELVVTFTQDSAGNWKADKTLQDIISAFKNNILIRANEYDKYGNYASYVLSSADDEEDEEYFDFSRLSVSDTGESAWLFNIRYNTSGISRSYYLLGNAIAPT